MEQGRPLVGCSVLSSLLTQWFLSCFSLMVVEGPVKIVLGPAPAVTRLRRLERNLCALLAGAAPRFAKRACGGGFRANGWRKSRSRLNTGTSRTWSLKPKGGPASDDMVRESQFLVLTGMLRLVLGVMYYVYKRFRNFRPHTQKKKMYKRTYQRTHKRAYKKTSKNTYKKTYKRTYFYIPI